ncbi:MAG: YceI family protein [Crocinitomicaceae bacterium]|nr:YceI family protein [Crocinitomicaceae bacterium]
MNAIVLISMITLSGVGLFLEFKRNTKLEDAFYLLLFVVISLWASAFFSDLSVSPIYGLIAMVALNYVFSKADFLVKPYVRVIVPTIMAVGYLLIFNEHVIEVIDNSYVFVNKFLVLAVFIALFGYEIALIKAKFLGKLFGDMSEQEMVKGLHLFFIGVTVFLGYFAASSFGALAVSAVLLSAGFYRVEKSLNVAGALLGLAVLPLMAFNAGLTDVNLVAGDVLEGVFIGAFGAYFISKTAASPKVKPLGIILAHIIAVGLIIGVLFLELMYSRMGGVDAFIGALVGLSVVNALIGKGYSLGVLVINLVILGSIIPPYLVNDELEAFKGANMEQVDAGNGEQIRISYLPFEGLSGRYDMVKDSSNVSFILGAKGETKGAFKKLEGSFMFDNDHSKSNLNVVLDLNDFTTFNSYRDGSLMEESYFHKEKYPTLEFNANNFILADKETLKVKGEFTMLGVSKTIEVTLKRLKVDGQEVLVGEGELDRTEFGMSPSATEGNVVSFEYRVLLKQQ